MLTKFFILIISFFFTISGSVTFCAEQFNMAQGWYKLWEQVVVMETTINL